MKPDGFWNRCLGSPEFGMDYRRAMNEHFYVFEADPWLNVVLGAHDGDQEGLLVFLGDLRSPLVWLICNFRNHLGVYLDFLRLPLKIKLSYHL